MKLYDPPKAHPALCRRLNEITDGLSLTVDPTGNRSVLTEWLQTGPIPTACFWLTGTLIKVELTINEDLTDAEIATQIATIIKPIALDRTSRDCWLIEGKPQFGIVLIERLHRQLLLNAKIDVMSYMDRIGGEKYIHHEPDYSGGDYFTVPSLDGDMKRLPQGLGDIVLDKHGLMNCTLSLTLSDSVTLDIGNDAIELRIAKQIPQTIKDSMIGQDMFDFINIEALAGTPAIITRIDTSPASQMRPEMTYIIIEPQFEYAAGQIWNRTHEQKLDDRLSNWVRKNIK